MFRNNVGVARHVHNRKASFVHYGVGGDGAPDTMGWTRLGAFAAVELKAAGKRPDLDQVKWMLMAVRANGLRHVYWADNVEDALAILEPCSDAVIRARIGWLEGWLDGLLARAKK
jgi:hypothetical protein